MSSFSLLTRFSRLSSSHFFQPRSVYLTQCHNVCFYSSSSSSSSSSSLHSSSSSAASKRTVRKERNARTRPPLSSSSSSKSVKSTSQSLKSPNLSSISSSKQVKQSSSQQLSNAKKTRPPRRRTPVVKRHSYTLPDSGLSAAQLAALTNGSVNDVLAIIKSAQSLDIPIQNARHVIPVTAIDLIVEDLQLPIDFESQKYDLLTTTKNMKEKDMQKRMPIVTVMGHVDHGKTSLLDALRRSNVANGEAGGITQSVAAFPVSLSSSLSSSSNTNEYATFIDTPGHAAFSSMRAHGAIATDIIVLVIAADDGIKPQTEECVKLARASHIPIIIALNKCDLPSAMPDQIRTSLLQYLNINCEQLGGDIQCIEISAKTGKGLDDLIDAIIIQSDIMQLVACNNPTVDSHAICLESRIDRSLGSVASVVVRDGILQKGQYVAFQTTDTQMDKAYGKIRQLVNHQGQEINQAFPGSAVGISGISVPIPPGAQLKSVKNERNAKDIARQITMRNTSAITTIQKANHVIADRKQKAARRLRAMNSNTSTTTSSSNNNNNLTDSTTSSSLSEEMEQIQKESEMDLEMVDHFSIDNKSNNNETDFSKAHNINLENDINSHITNSKTNRTKPKVEIQVVIKGDVRGSADAVAQCLTGLSNQDVEVRVVRIGVGDVTEADVSTSSVNHVLQQKERNRRIKKRKQQSHNKNHMNEDEIDIHTAIICFNVKVRESLRKSCSMNDVKILTHDIIYRLEDDLKEWIDTLVAPKMQDIVTAKANVLRVFDGGNIAGCNITHGSIHLGDKVEIFKPNGKDVLQLEKEENEKERKNEQDNDDGLMVKVFEGKISSLKQYAKDVRTVKKGFECGIAVEGWDTFERGDEVRAIGSVQIENK